MDVTPSDLAEQLTAITAQKNAVDLSEEWWLDAYQPCPAPVRVAIGAWVTRIRVSNIQGGSSGYCGLDEIKVFRQFGIPPATGTAGSTTAAPSGGSDGGGGNAGDSDLSHCVRIITSSNDPGTMDVYIDGVQVRTGFWGEGSTVLEECYPEKPSVEVQNPTNNAWGGTIVYSSDGGVTYAPYGCASCGLGSGPNTICVDGNFDCSNYHYYCVNGARCQMTQPDTNAGESTGSPAADGTDAPISGEPTTTPMPTVTPTADPTQMPTETPTEGPTQMPTETPTEGPTPMPTETPTEGPTPKPTETPTEGPTPKPTVTNTEGPTPKPTET